MSRDFCRVPLAVRRVRGMTAAARRQVVIPDTPWTGREQASTRPADALTTFSSLQRRLYAPTNPTLVLTAPAEGLWGLCACALVPLSVGSVPVSVRACVHVRAGEPALARERVFSYQATRVCARIAA